MNTKANTPKKPFGLTVAVKVALEAIHDSVAPSSVVLSNLFFLQKTSSFPKNLDKDFFAHNKYFANDNEKKAISILLEELKKPKVDPQELLETLFAQNWTKKIPPKVEKSAPLKVKTNAKKPTKKAVTKKENVTPIVTIKKTRMV
jgi:hypothetical protein